MNMLLRCTVCNVQYCSDLPEDRQLHRKRHRQTMAVIDPQPYPLLARRYAAHGSFVPVRSNSPRFLRTRIYEIARRFHRELHFDFVPCSDRSDPGHHGYIITDREGRALGAFGVRWCDSKWMLTWVWIAPAYRRQGWLRRAWEMVMSVYPNIKPDPPFSHAAASFFRSCADISDEMREVAAQHAEQPGAYNYKRTA
jgi:hypothetical protein